MIHNEILEGLQEILQPVRNEYKKKIALEELLNGHFAVCWKNRLRSSGRLGGTGLLSFAKGSPSISNMTHMAHLEKDKAQGVEG